MATLAAKIEACLNSRPLCPMTTVGNDVLALTPGHFLIGSSLLAPPEPPSDTPNIPSTHNRWLMLTHLRNSFWARWRREVFSQLQQRNKWQKTQPNLKEGDVVLVTDELTPASQWPLARVIACHPGADQLVRVVTLRTSTTELKRPVCKLVKLPVDEQVEETFKKQYTD